MGALYLDIEVLADREEELRELFTELNEMEGSPEGRPQLIQDELPSWDNWGEAA